MINKHQGSCVNCGARVGAGAGLWDVGIGLRHQPGGCTNNRNFFDDPLEDDGWYEKFGDFHYHWTSEDVNPGEGDK